MKKSFFFLIVLISTSVKTFAGNGDSIFNMQYIHTLHITFPYPAFYDSLLNTNVTDQYLNVSIDFNGDVYTNVGIKVKGNSSFNNPSQKKSFKLDFNEFIAGQDIHGLKKLNFNNSFKDPSFMREKLTNDFLIDHDIPAPRTTYCNVYLNGQLWGLYTILEEVDDEFCKHWFNNSDGNLFKGDPHGDLKWKGSAAQSLYETEYELKNNSTANNWSDLISLINVINNTPSANLQTALDPVFNTQLFVKQWAVLNMFSSLDSYIGSGHNYYLYHDTAASKFQWIAWDNNEAFGSFKMSLSTTQLKNLDIYYLSNPSSRPLCNALLNNSYYKKLYNDAYCELKQDFTNNRFDPYIDSIKNMIQSSVYADPKKFYSNMQFDSSFNYDINLGGPAGITVFGLKSFIAARTSSINTSFTSNNVVCWPNAVSHSEEQSTQLTLFPNPVNDLLTIQSAEIIREIKLIDMTGRVILLQEPHLTRMTTIDLRPFASGLYLLSVNEGKNYRILK